jgi:hypothetical protein
VILALRHTRSNATTTSHSLASVRTATAQSSAQRMLPVSTSRTCARGTQDLRTCLSPQAGDCTAVAKYSISGLRTAAGPCGLSCGAVPFNHTTQPRPDSAGRCNRPFVAFHLVFLPSSRARLIGVLSAEYGLQEPPWSPRKPASNDRNMSSAAFQLLLFASAAFARKAANELSAAAPVLASRDAPRPGFPDGLLGYVTQASQT